MGSHSRLTLAARDPVNWRRVGLISDAVDQEWHTVRSRDARALFHPKPAFLSMTVDINRGIPPELRAIPPELRAVPDFRGMLRNPGILAPIAELCLLGIYAERKIRRKR